jgi:ABC-2 type transport system ATP-binding protein
MTWGVDRLTVRFGGTTALEDVSLDAPPGEVTGVVGGDGAGKSTLLRVLAGAQPAASGTVRRPDDREIGYLAASSGTYPDLSVAENLAFAAGAYGVPERQVAQLASVYLDRTGLSDVQDRLAGNLSGGMRQKLGVIRAMLHRPKLLVLDEPTTGIDPVSRADLWWLIARAAAEGAAVVLTTTYLDEAERAASVLVLDAGRVLAKGTAAEIASAVPGTIRRVPERPTGEAAQRAWRRGGSWLVWTPPGTSDAAGPADSGDVDDGVRRPDLQDAVIVAALGRELAVPAAGRAS